MATHPVTLAEFDQVLSGHDTVIIDFWATWCPPCRAFGPIFDEASEKYPNVYFGKVDIDANQDLAAAQNIQSIPTVLVARNGAIVYKEPGALNADSLDKLIEESLKK